jgi:hypothetical protein
LIQLLVKHWMPQVWISSELAQAIKQTVPAIDLNWTTMKLPFPGMTFMLPRGAMTAKGMDVQFLTFGRVFVPEPRIIVVARPVKETNIWHLRGTERPILPLGDLTRFQAEFREYVERDLQERREACRRRRCT